MQGSSQDLATSSTQVGKVAEEVAIAIQHVAEGVDKQVQLSTKSANLIASMVSNMSETGKVVNAVMEVTVHSESAVAQGSAHINQAIMRMQQIREDVAQIARIYMTLSINHGRLDKLLM